MSITITKNVSPDAAKDIFELQQKINAFVNGEIPEDKFKHFRLTRGVYGQRQLGVQMFRIKIPMGRITPAQLVRCAELSELYGSSNLHLTTRQDIQLHYVKVDNAPLVWAGLEDCGLTGREACGNTVRNITASASAGIDKNEPFDVSPYVYALFKYLLRNPICQDMGRKIKIAFSSSEKDTAFTYIHDFGFIPKIENGIRGFKVVVGGGLGAQAILAQTAFEFLEDDKIIPFVEAGLRVFDRYGERTRRHKARMKYLVKELGVDQFLTLIQEEMKANAHLVFPVETDGFESPRSPEIKQVPTVDIKDKKRYEDWLETNVFEQKQPGFYGVYLKVTKGDIKPDQARVIAQLANDFASDDMRITMNQGMLLKYVRKEALPKVYSVLDSMGFANPGFGTIADITTCPGTDTCNLGVTNSMLLAEILEDVIQKEYYDLIFDKAIHIKMSGCMNSCGQHMSADIGLHGSSIRVGDKVAPAMQICLGGGVDNNGVGMAGDKVVKLPTKKMPEALRIILDDYENHSDETEYFNNYYRRQGKNYFYTLLKPIADTSKFVDDDFYDYGHDELFTPEVGVGECAGVFYDMVSTILKDAQLKQTEALQALDNSKYAEAIYYAYTGFVTSAKSLLLSKEVECNTQIKILQDFDRVFVVTGEITCEWGFEKLVLSINKHEPEREFAQSYVGAYEQFLNSALDYRNATMKADKLVKESDYKA
ncbi:MAG TPA: nitrite/sulfite reductase [Chitinophagales bacterium]|nr:nitrite/sulfite reductase [Chitinophagales bacterium]